ncbi:hypothetical protein GDO86_007751 [Hymenochirus boettgeri]|uniref:Axonemal dynein light chain domain containing 1 n=1 Tax=Hymenochirus boettgeri TaxID=247094 RepID=A0A8T2IZ76_9PIPI|nr:hypothetical protein GDO86_007751 [Hymenochirus boettgeri]
MSVTRVPSPPAAPRPSGRRQLGSRSVVPLSEAGADKCGALEPSKPLAMSQHPDHIPDEILQILTSASNAPGRCDLAPPKKTKDPKACLRSTDNIWHHQLRRGKFKHLIEQPVCLKGAGRDISFLCDFVLSEKNPKSLQPISGNKSADKAIQESLVPEEFYIVKNKGVLGLEYYEDKYTTLLKDDEKKLRLFPSMKPSGRLEVLQLIKVMDNMLKDAGVDGEDIKLDGPTPIHNLLELLKMEQNIYNIVFHEVIRQVSVECVERGELLAKLRQRYAMLLDKIPREVLSLYNELLAQRALDRCLTHEIIHFGNSIGEMTNELNQVKEHDLRVSREAKQAHAELARALHEAKKNANLLDEYRDLYELQRSRLEKHLVHLTEERDLWGSATYRIAKKVIEENQLHLARKLYLCEKSWTKVIRHFIVLLASTNAKDLLQIQKITETWRGYIARFDQELQRNEESSREKLRLIQNDLDKWLQHFQEKILVGGSSLEVHRDVISLILQDLRRWDKMLNEELLQFEGAQLLSYEDSLKTALDIQNQWVDLGEKVLRRHKSSDGNLSSEEQALSVLKSKIQELCQWYRKRIEGENGVADALLSFVSSLKDWSSHITALESTRHGIRESDWSDFCQHINEWKNLTNKMLSFIGCHELSEEINSDDSEIMSLDNVFKKLQHWVLAMTNGTERDDLQLTSEVNTLHTALVLLMVNALLHLAPDHPSDVSKGSLELSFQEAEFTQATVEEMKQDVLTLSQKLFHFSCFVIGCCQEMVEDISIQKASILDEDPDHELKELDTIKNLCNDWIETSHLLLAEITKHSDVRMPSLPLESRSLENSTEDRRETSPEGDTAEREVRIIWHDGNIHVKPLSGEEIPVSPEGVLIANRPETPKSTQAFEFLKSMEYLQNRLLQTELRAQKAEERSEALDEQLKEALLKIQQLKISHELCESSNLTNVETTTNIETTEGQPSISLHSKKKRPKSVKSKS